MTTQPNENIAGAVRNIFGEAISHKQIHVKWISPLIANGNITKYRIYYTEPDGADLFIDSAGPETEMILTDLHPFTDYSIYVVPFNENGMGDSSHEIIVKTFSDTPGESPLNITLEATSSTVSITYCYSNFFFSHKFHRFLVCLKIVNNGTMATTTT